MYLDYYNLDNLISFSGRKKILFKYYYCLDNECIQISQIYASDHDGVITKIRLTILTQSTKKNPKYMKQWF